jgi:hypothetical protein
MQKLYILIVFILLTNSTFAQPDPVGNFNRHVVEKWGSDYIRIGPYRVKGSPYFLGESFPGSLIYKSGRRVTDAKILYDLYSQKAGIDVENGIYESGEALEEFSIVLLDKFGGQTLLFKNSSLFGDAALKSYLNVLEDGDKVTLLKIFKTKLSPDPRNNLAKDSKVFEQYYEYYLYNKTSQDLNKIKLRQKDIVKELGNDQLVNDYVSKSEIDFSKEADLIKLINKYNNSFQ